MKEIPPVDKIYDLREVLSNLISEFPQDQIVYRTMSRSFTAKELAYEINNRTDFGNRYATDLLRISRDLLVNQAKK